MLYHYKYFILSLLLLTTVVEYSCKQKTNTEHTGHEQHDEQKAVYTCSMHPEIIRDAPGKCPICGMELVMKGGSEKEITAVDLNTLLQPSNEFVVSSVPATTMETSKQPVEVNALGSVTYDTRQVGTISAKYSGRIERLYVRYRFQKVIKGQRIMDIYSPELMTAQENILFLLQNDTQNTSLINAARQRLMLLGMTSSQISSIIQNGKPLFAVPVYSEYTGHIHEAIADGMATASQVEMRDMPETTEALSLMPGMYVQKGQTLFSVYNSNKVWAILSIYEEVHTLVEKGDAVTIVPETAPEKQFRGKIDYIEPFFRAGSKTLTARVYFDNSRLQVPIGSQVKATIYSKFEAAAWLPATAVISLGAEKVVFVS